MGLIKMFCVTVQCWDDTMTWGQKALHSPNTKVLGMKGSLPFSVQPAVGMILNNFSLHCRRMGGGCCPPCSFFLWTITVVTLKFTSEEAFFKKVHAQTVFLYKSFAVRLYWKLIIVTVFPWRHTGGLSMWTVWSLPGFHGIGRVDVSERHLSFCGLIP